MFYRSLNLGFKGFNNLKTINLATYNLNSFLKKKTYHFVGCESKNVCIMTNTTKSQKLSMHENSFIYLPAVMKSQICPQRVRLIVHVCITFPADKFIPTIIVSLGTKNILSWPTRKSQGSLFTQKNNNFRV
jgi:hypothetical protein